MQISSEPESMEASARLIEEMNDAMAKQKLEFHAPKRTGSIIDGLTEHRSRASLSVFKPESSIFFGRGERQYVLSASKLNLIVSPSEIKT